MAVKWITSVSTGVILIRRDPSTSMVWSTKNYWDIHYGIEKGLAPILAFGEGMKQLNPSSSSELYWAFNASAAAMQLPVVDNKIRATVDYPIVLLRRAIRLHKLEKI